MSRPPRKSGEDADPSRLAKGLADGVAMPPAVCIAGSEHGGLDAKVLVLNRAYAAVRVITARRAFVLLARDCAEVIDATGCVVMPGLVDLTVRWGLAALVVALCLWALAETFEKQPQTAE